MLNTQILIGLLQICLLTNALVACSDEPGAVEQTLEKQFGGPELAADGVLSSAMIFNSAVHSAFGRVKDDLEADPFAFYAAIHEELEQEVISIDHIFENLAEELLELMHMTDEDVRAAKVYAHVKRFAELISLPRESIPPRRHGQFLDDCIMLNAEMWVTLSDPHDEHDQVAYYFAPALNVVASTHLYGLAAAGYKRITMEHVYRDVIDSNLHMVGTGEADDLGSLSDWVAAQTKGSESARKKYDQDPILFSIRRVLAEQQAALE